jgi:FAD synthetase
MKTISTANTSTLHSLPSLSLSYNGGKDCLVLLILYLSLLSTHSHLPALLSAIYIPPDHPFPSVDAFVASSSTRYHLSLQHYHHPSMRLAFTHYLADNPSIRAIFVGTRRTDPHGGNLTAFDETDRGWPSFMRVHPVIDWRYAEVWAFLRWMGVEYCGLYDRGYTSLGGMGDTHPNPVLKIEGEGDGERYRPAYELEKDGEERLGRDARG